MAREYFNAYHSYLKSMEALNDAERGRLFTACLQYSMTGEAQKLPGNERILFPAMREQIDRDKAAYAAKCRQQSKNIAKRWNTTVYHGIPIDTKDTKEKEKEKEKEKDISPSISPPRHKYGEYGWVQLTDAEYKRLVFDIGEQEAERVIAYVDESAQSTGNKNKWRDWNLVVRKASREGWGRNKGTSSARSSRALNHGQRKYTDAQLEKIGKDMIDQ